VSPAERLIYLGLQVYRGHIVASSLNILTTRSGLRALQAFEYFYSSHDLVHLGILSSALELSQIFWRLLPGVSFG
jgi:hypothetical protein